jgi:hypothetical protein
MHIKRPTIDLDQKTISQCTIALPAALACRDIRLLLIYINVCALQKAIKINTRTELERTNALRAA